MQMKKEYIKPSINTIELENGASILAGSLKGSVDGQIDIQYGGDTTDEDITKDDDNNIWGD
jgi:hypothetical protein